MKVSRRSFLDFLKATCAVAALPSFSQEVLGVAQRGVSLPIISSDSSNNGGAIVNDIHSQLNATRVTRIIRPLTSNDLRATILTAISEGKSISVAGGRHSMGGQQFGAGTILVDMRGMNRVLNLDSE